MKITPEYIQQVKDDILEGKLPIPEGYDRATGGLFWEKRHSSPCKPLYNLKEYDDKENGVLSMYQIYMQCPTEYDAALVLLGSVNHWNTLCECDWFKEHIARWRYEMSVRNTAIGEAVIYQNAVKGDTRSAKLLLEQNTPKTPRTAAGKRKQRPTKDNFEGDVDTFLQAGLQAINNDKRN